MDVNRTSASHVEQALILSFIRYRVGTRLSRTVSKAGDSFQPVPILVAELGIEAEHLLLIAGERAAQAIILVLVPVIEHVHVNLPHQAARAAVIQLTFSTLSHVRDSPFS